MAETLGMLCDKLTIVKLKQYHSEDAARLESLGIQATQLQEEINNRLITFIFDKLTKEQFVTILQRTEKINELNSPDFFIDGRGIYQISFTVYKPQQKAIDKILELQKELFPNN